MKKTKRVKQTNQGAEENQKKEIKTTNEEEVFNITEKRILEAKDPNSPENIFEFCFKIGK